MIYYLQGRLVELFPSALVVEAGHIGYFLHVSEQTREEMKKKLGGEIKIWVRQRMTDDEVVWYGFLNHTERDMFEKLLSVSGVGPKSALSILSLGRIDRLSQAIDQSNVSYLSQASGIGKKTAQRIIVELKGKLVSDDRFDGEVDEAMKTLGYKRAEYDHLVTMLPVELTVEEKITWLVKQM